MNITYEFSEIVSTCMLVLIGLWTIINLLRPQRIVLMYIVGLLLFTGSTYGISNPGSAMNSLSTAVMYTFYGRGSGTLPLSFLNVYLLALFVLLIFIRGRRNNALSYDDPTLRYQLFIAIAYCLYVAVGLGEGITTENALSTNGAIQFLNLLCMSLILRWSLVSQEDIQLFTKYFSMTCQFMAIYGLFRFALGGDPANYYGNVEGLKVRITFFDIGQSVLFCIAIVVSYLQRDSNNRVKAKNIVFILLYLSNIILSYRRNAWVGITLVAFWFFFTQNFKRKVALFALALLILPVALEFSRARFTSATSGGRSPSLTGDFLSSKGQIEIKKGRFSELYSAMMVAGDSPLVGLGPWAKNKEFIISHGDSSDSFVHSSLVHLFLKMGLLGLVPYLLLLLSFPFWWMRARKVPWNDQRLKCIGEAFFCGFLCWIPDIAFGTPGINFRHFQILAMTLAVPVAAYAIDRGLANNHTTLGETA